MAGEFSCEIVTWDQFYNLARLLSKGIKSSGYRPDVVIAIGRGGYVPARVLCDFLLRNQLTSIKVEHWDVAAARKEQARIRSPLAIEITGLNVLIVDDLTDTGDTLVIATEYIRRFCPKEIRTAVLQHKSNSVFQPDYYAEYISRWSWIIYPWAFYEDLVGFTDKIVRDGEFSLQAIKKELAGRYQIPVDERELRDAIDDLISEGKVLQTGSFYRGADG